MTREELGARVRAAASPEHQCLLRQVVTPEANVQGVRGQRGRVAWVLGLGQDRGGGMPAYPRRWCRLPRREPRNLFSPLLDNRTR